MFYRVQQFIKAITASVSGDEKRWIKGYLTEKEQALFFKLKVYEQKHALCVAKLLSEWTNESQEMIRLGLLHDIGKVLYPLNPIQKSIIVILHKVTFGKIKRFNQFKIVKCYYEHPILGSELLSRQGVYEKEFLECIKRHHELIDSDKISPNLSLLQKADNLC